MAKLPQYPSLFEECNKPTMEKPPPVVLFSCIYEFVSVLDCAARGMTQNDSIYNDINGTIITISVGVFNNLSVTMLAPGNSIITVGAPVTHPWSLGYVTAANWKILAIDQGMRNVNTITGGPGWIHTPHHNALSNTNRWKVAKFYYETRTYLPKWDPETGVLTEFKCPIFTSYSPPSPTADWWEQHVTCPKYYELKACTSCNAETSNIPNVLVESSDDNMDSPIINAKPVGAKDNTGAYQCYDVISKPQGEGVRTDSDLYLAPPPNPVPGQLNTFYKNLVIENFTGGKDNLYKNYKDCQECRLPYILITSDVANCESEGCDAALVGRINIINAWDQQIQDWVDAGNLNIYSLDKNANNDAFFNKHGQIFYFWEFTGAALNIKGRCKKAYLIDIPSLRSVGSCAHKDIIDRALANNMGDIGSRIPDAQIYKTTCTCETGGGYIGSPIDQSSAWKACHPLSGSLTILTHPTNQEVDEGEDAIFSTSVTAPNAFFNWRIEKPGLIPGTVMASSNLWNGMTWNETDSSGVRRTISVSISNTTAFGVRYSTITLKNVSTNISEWNVVCTINNGLGTTKQTNRAMLVVNETAKKIILDSTTVTLMKISSWCIDSFDPVASGYDVKRGALSIDNEYRWVVGDFSAWKNKWFLTSTTGANLRATCLSSAWDCKKIGGIEYASNLPRCSIFWDGLDSAGTLNQRPIAFKINEITATTTWKYLKRRYPFVKGITPKSKGNETNRWQLGILSGPYNKWDEIPYVVS